LSEEGERMRRGGAGAKSDDGVVSDGVGSGDTGEKRAGVGQDLRDRGSTC